MKYTLLGFGLTLTVLIGIERMLYYDVFNWLDNHRIFNNLTEFPKKRIVFS